jgi:hypothetical protein
VAGNFRSPQDKLSGFDSDVSLPLFRLLRFTFRVIPLNTARIRTEIHEGSVSYYGLLNFEIHRCNEITHYFLSSILKRNDIRSVLAKHKPQKSYVFWNITPHSPLKVNRCFGGTCSFRNVGCLSTKYAALCLNYFRC